MHRIREAPDPAGVPADVATMVGVLTACMTDGDRSGWSSSARSENVVALLRSFERVQAEVLRALGEWDATQDWAVDGALSGPSWLAGHTPLSKTEARDLLRAARLVHRQRATAAALAAGEITAPQVGLLARAARGREELFERDEHVLLEAAASLNLDDFAASTRYWTTIADDQLHHTDPGRSFARRSVTLAATLDGRVELHASLDPDGGAIVKAALDAADHPDPVGSEARTSAQRRADALVQICSETLGAARATRGRHVPTVEVVCDVERLARFVPLRDANGASPTTSQAPSDARTLFPSPTSGPVPCEIVGIGPIGTNLLRRLACDSAVVRMVVRGASDVLDVGRATRVIPFGLRRALVRRDRGCAFPGCDAPPGWCDAHHIVHWADGGTTDLDNCVLLCRRHHGACHEGGWQLARGPDGGWEVAERGRPTRTLDRGG